MAHRKFVGLPNEKMVIHSTRANSASEGLGSTCSKPSKLGMADVTMVTKWQLIWGDEEWFQMQILHIDDGTNN